jgi:hypothetical protein
VAFARAGIAADLTLDPVQTENLMTAQNHQKRRGCLCTHLPLQSGSKGGLQQFVLNQRLNGFSRMAYRQFVIQCREDSNRCRTI